MSQLIFDFERKPGSRSSQRQRILNHFKSYGRASTHDLMRYAANYTMRISDLRREGYVIKARRVQQGNWVYTYEGKR